MPLVCNENETGVTFVSKSLFNDQNLQIILFEIQNCTTYSTAIQSYHAENSKNRSNGIFSTKPVTISNRA